MPPVWHGLIVETKTPGLRPPGGLAMNEVNTLAAEAEMACFVNCLYEPSDLVEFRLISQDGPPLQEWRRAIDIGESLDRLIHNNDHGYDIYFGANPRSQRGGRGEDVLLARSLFVDFDGVPATECVMRYDNAGLPAPTMTVYTGNGFHFYWKLAEPMVDLAEWTKRQKALIAKVDSDPKIHDAPRIMRVPGFVNRKPERHGAMATLIDCRPERVYDIDQFPGSKT